MRYVLLDKNFAVAEPEAGRTIEDQIGPDFDVVPLSADLAALVRDDCLMIAGSPLAALTVYESGGKTDLVRGPVCIVRIDAENRVVEPAPSEAEIIELLGDAVDVVTVIDIEGVYHIVGRDDIPRRHPSIPFCYFFKTDIVN